MKYIKLTQGKYAIVDDEDFKWVNKWKWFFGDRYAVRTVYQNGIYVKRLKMHRFILDAPENKTVDHINGNKLDNRRSNLRICSFAENAKNRKKYKGITTSIFKGVSHISNRQRGKPWRACISINGKSLQIGKFDNERHAALAYDLNAEMLYGEFANLNFNQERIIYE